MHGEFCTSRWLYDTVAPSTFCDARVHAVLELSIASQTVLTVGAQTPKDASVVLHLGGMIMRQVSSHFSVPLQ